MTIDTGGRDKPPCSGILAPGQKSAVLKENQSTTSFKESSLSSEAASFCRDLINPVDELSYTVALSGLKYELSVLQAARVIDRFARNVNPEKSTSDLGEIINALNVNFLERKDGKCGSQIVLTFSEEEKVALNSMFTSISERFTKDNLAGHSDHSFRSDIIRLFEDNSELCPLALNLLGDILVSKTNKDNLRSLARSIQDHVPFKDTVDLFAKAAGKNLNFLLYSDYPMDALAQILRTRLETGFSEEEKQSLRNFFEVISQKIPDISALLEADEASIRSLCGGLHSFFNRNPEVAPLGSELVNNLLTATENNNALTDLFSIARDILPFSEGITALTRFVREGRIAPGRSCRSSIDSLRDVIYRKRTENEPITFSEEETLALSDFFSAVSEKLQAMSHYEKMGAGNSLLDLPLENREIAKKVSDILLRIVPEVNETSFLRHVNEAIRNFFPLSGSLTLLNAVYRGNRGEFISLAFENMVPLLSENLRRERGENPSFGLSPEEIQGFTTLFNTLNQRIPLFVAAEIEGSTESVLRQFLDQNPEVAPLGQKLLVNFKTAVVERLRTRISQIVPGTSEAEIERIVDGTTQEVEEIITGINRYAFLNDVLGNLPQDQKQQILEGLDKYTQGYEGEQRKRLLEQIFINREGNYLSTFLQSQRISLQDLPRLLNDEAVISLVSIMVDDLPRYRSQLGIILSQTPFVNIPDNIKAKLKPTVSEFEFSIEPGHGNWFLCSQAEPRLLTSLENQAFVLVNERMLLKFNGKFSALCLETFTSANGITFVEGNWYSPVGKEFRDAIIQAFDIGASAISANNGTWALMRPLSDSPQSSANGFLQLAREKVKNLPPFFPRNIGRLTREEYRKEYREES